jgi:hypothetical protein
MARLLYFSHKPQLKFMQSIRLFIFILFFFPAAAHSQDTLIHKLDSLTKKTDSAGHQLNNIDPAAYNEETKLTAKTYFILLGSNIKQEFTKPFHMTKKDFGNLGKFAVVAVGVGLADETIQKEALRLRNRSANVQNVGKFISNFGGLYEAYTLAAFGAYGIIFKSQKVKTTTLLATQAVITGGLVESVLKTLTGRLRPNYYAPGVEAEPSFKGPFVNTSRDFAGKRSNSSFPSGHSTVAFAAATVFAVEYKNKPFIPIIAYSAATLIGLSRITENKHWATDILTGAALGYVTGRQISYNYHRYAKLKAPTQVKNTVSLDIHYQWGRLMPGILYTFNKKHA